MELLKNKQFTQVKNNNIHLIYYKKELLGIYIINKKVLYYTNSKIFFCGDYNRVEAKEVGKEEIQGIYNNIIINLEDKKMEKIKNLIMENNAEIEKLNKRLERNIKDLQDTINSMDLYTILNFTEQKLERIKGLYNKIENIEYNNKVLKNILEG